MIQGTSVKEGQRYAQRLSFHQRVNIWKVGAILANNPGIPHARLVNVADPLVTKTISCSTLRNRMHFELVAETATGMG